DVGLRIGEFSPALLCHGRPCHDQGGGKGQQCASGGHQSPDLWVGVTPSRAARSLVIFGGSLRQLFMQGSAFTSGRGSPPAMKPSRLGNLTCARPAASSS